MTEVSPEGARVSHLLSWLIGLATVVVGLVGTVPPFEKMFAETGISLTPITRALLSVSQWARSWEGVAGVVAVALASVVIFAAKRESPNLRRMLVALSTLCVLSIPVGIYAVFVSLLGMT